VPHGQGADRTGCRPYGVPNAGGECRGGRGDGLPIIAAFVVENLMEAERLNQIAATASSLQQRQAELRRYL
jgi:hypothetical protein